MRYILDSFGYIETISFLYGIECNNKSCTEYKGTVPEGYTSLIEWSEKATIQAYKIVEGNLVYDADKENELIAKWEKEKENTTDADLTDYIKREEVSLVGKTGKYSDLLDEPVSLTNTEIEELLNNQEGVM